MKTKERLVNDQGLVLYAQLCCGKRCVNVGCACCYQKIICKFPSGLRINLLKKLLCLQVFMIAAWLNEVLRGLKRP